VQEEKNGNLVKLKKVKEKGDLTILYFSNGEKYTVFTNFILDYALKIDALYSIQLLSIIARVEEKTLLYRYTINLTNKKLFSKAELKVKLNEKFKDSSNLIDEIIAELESYKLIDDSYYASTYKEYLDSIYYGKYYIINFLNKKQIDKEIIGNLIFDTEKEEEKALEYFNQIKNLYVSKNFTKQKRSLYSTMLNRGFSIDVILSVLNNLYVDKNVEFKSLKNDYDKFVNKNRNKYNEDELETRVINFLVTKGYLFEDIKEFIYKLKEGEIKND